MRKKICFFLQHLHVARVVAHFLGEGGLKKKEKMLKFPLLPPMVQDATATAEHEKKNPNLLLNVFCCLFRLESRIFFYNDVVIVMTKQLFLIFKVIFQEFLK